VGTGTPATTSYDAADRATSGVNPTSAYTSNADAMLTARPGQTLTWNHLGRLTAVKNAAGTVTLATYTYDPLDRLRTAAASGSSTGRAPTAISATTAPTPTTTGRGLSPLPAITRTCDDRTVAACGPCRGHNEAVRQGTRTDQRAEAVRM
jgi:YD repeat-containing protein